jgi:DNA-binding GntR family transcriptional regulator
VLPIADVRDTGQPQHQLTIRRKLPDSNGARGGRVARAYRVVREMIVRGRLAPGARVVENDIAATLGVSRTPVRSALHRLRQEGYIVGVGGPTEQRLMVARATREDARELFLMVAAMEGLAARRCAGRASAVRSAVAGRLRGLNAELSAIGRAARPDSKRFSAADTAFHRTFVEAGAGPRLLALHEAIKPQADRYIHLYTTWLTAEIEQSVGEHEVIVRAIEAGKGAAAQAAVQRNWSNAATRLGTVLATLDEGPGERL